MNVDVGNSSQKTTNYFDEIEKKAIVKSYEFK